MSKGIVSQNQRPLFELPTLPEQIAEKFGFLLPSQHHEGIKVYHVQAWITGVAQSKSARKLWNALQTDNPKLSTLSRQLTHTANDGKKYRMDFTDAYGLYVITGHLRAKSGIRDEVIEIMAKSTDFVDWANRNPDLAAAGFTKLADKRSLLHNQRVTGHILSGKSQEWAEIRATSSETQNQINGGLLATHVDRKPDFGKVAQIQNRELFNKTKNEIIAELGLTTAQSKKYRNFLGKYALQAINLVNKASLKKMTALGRALTSDEQEAIVREQAQRAARIMREAADMEGIDFLSGAQLDEQGNALIQRQRPLLPRGNSQ